MAAQFRSRVAAGVSSPGPRGQRPLAIAALATISFGFAAGCAPGPPEATELGLTETTATSPDQPWSVQTGPVSTPGAIHSGVATTTPFHGLACPDTAEVPWDATDLCGDDAGCDLVVISGECGIVELLDGALHQCLARDNQGDWDQCSKVLGVSEAEAWSLIEAAYGYNGQHALVLVEELMECYRPIDPSALPSTFHVASSGLQFFYQSIDHIACASPYQSDSWGGAAPVGATRVPIREECVDMLSEGGWAVYDSEELGGPAAESSPFLMETVLTGHLADL